jgi:glyoxylase-like metal-dependent hydrolase (beta-lactamase superfamily II)
MAKVKVLIEGYAKEVEGGWLASSTTTLIEDKGKKIVVDPGTNRRLLLENLKKQGLTPDDIDMVFLTHFHIDHILLAGIFEMATVLDKETIYEEDEETEYEGKIPGTNLKVIPTPGHADEHATIIAETDKGKVAVAQDLFWWTKDQLQETDDAKALIERDDPFVKDMKALKESRRKILEIANWIVPGHGKMFKSPSKK